MQAAYKMKEASAKAPKLEVRRGDASRRAAARRQSMARGLLALTMLALVCAVIYSHVQLTELTGEIQDARAELTTANSWNSYWNNTLDSKTNLRMVGGSRHHPFGDDQGGSQPDHLYQAG